MRYGTEDRIKQLQAEIDQLRAEQELRPVWEPDNGEVYHVANGNMISQYHWFYDEMDKYYLKMGNLFETKQKAENHTRALELIETIRRERYKAQGHWWSSEYEGRYTVCWNQLGNRAYISALSWELSSSVFGLWRDAIELRYIINKYESEFEWYFTEYLPSIN